MSKIKKIIALAIVSGIMATGLISAFAKGVYGCISPYNDRGAQATSYYGKTAEIMGLSITVNFKRKDGTYANTYSPQYNANNTQNLTKNLSGDRGSTRVQAWGYHNAKFKNDGRTYTNESYLGY